VTAARARRIAVLELLVSSQLGGGPAHVEALVRHLDPAEFAVTVGAPAGGPFLERFRTAGADVVEIAADRLSPRTLTRVGRLIRARGAAVVHSHGKGAGLYGRLAARRAGAAAVHTFHGLHYAGYPPGARAIYLALERVLARRSHTVIHVSASQAAAARPLGLAPADRSRVILNGVDTARLEANALPRERARAELGVPPEGAVLGTVARFDPVKALEVLLEALPRVPGATLVLIGDGPEAAPLRARARGLGLEARVVFAGARLEAARWFAALDAYVSASRGEGLPLALVEAMATGLPVIASRVSGHVDTVTDGETGVLVPVDDPAALAAAAAALLADPARARALGAAGRARARRDFSVDRMAAEVAEVYRRAAAATV
jgi:glycosyltransferase involved in cell wall biosynthesis